MVNTVETPGQNKGPYIAINGFIAWFLIMAMTAIYLLWGILPVNVLHRMRITYYPDKYWAVAIPALVVMFFFSYYVTHVGIVLLITHPLDDGHCVTDVDVKEDTKHTSAALSKDSVSVPAWVDIPVTVSSRLLFLPSLDEVQ